MMSAFALGSRQVRRSGYGAMQLAGQFAFGPPPDRAAALAVLRAAADAGVNHIDTAQSSPARSWPGPPPAWALPPRRSVALAWLLQLAPNVLLIPGTGTVAHLRENLAAEDVTLDDEAFRTLSGIAGPKGRAQ